VPFVLSHRNEISACGTNKPIAKLGMK